MALMHPGLTRLFTMRLRGLRRRMGRNLRTTKGKITFFVGIAVFALWLAPSLGVAMSGKMADPEKLENFFPLAMLGLTMLTVFTSAGDKAIYFSPAEVDFLFSGPFGRRQLLVFRLWVNAVQLLFNSLIFMIIFLRFGAHWYAAFVGAFVSLLFIQLLSMSLMLTGQMLAARAYTKFRKIMLLALLAGVGFALTKAMSAGTGNSFSEIVDHMRETRPLRWILLPLTPYAKAVAARSLYPDLFLWTGVAVAVDLALFGVVMLLDAEYRDGAVAVSERYYARLQRMRQSGVAATAKNKATWRLPRLPWLGGAGPIVWRQAINAGRNVGSLVGMLIFLGIFVGAPIVVKGKDFEGYWPTIGMGIFWVSIILSMSVRYDFRADLERLEWLKTSPIRPMAIAIGQLVIPVLVCTLIQTAALAAAASIKGQLLIVPAAVAFALPVNLLLLGVDNALFLLFPSKVVAFNPGDFQMFGKQLIMMMAKMLAALGCGVVAALVGLVVYVVACAVYEVESQALSSKALMPALAAGWVVVVLCSAAVIPVAAHIYNRFDVSLHMPAD